MTGRGKTMINGHTAAVVLCVCAWPLPAFAQAPKKPDLSQFGRGEGRLMVGQMASDFSLKKPHSSDTITLSSFRGQKPVALIFGSFT